MSHRCSLNIFNPAISADPRIERERWLVANPVRAQSAWACLMCQPERIMSAS